MILKLLLGGAAALTMSTAALAQTASTTAPTSTSTSTSTSTGSPDASSNASASTSPAPADASPDPGPDTSAWTTIGVTAPGVAGGVQPYQPAGVAPAAPLGGFGASPHGRPHRRERERGPRQRGQPVGPDSGGRNRERRSLRRGGGSDRVLQPIAALRG
ncbi:MAG: hypothetical protein WDN45_10730 [Caulobacteraceae bacterium]